MKMENTTSQSSRFRWIFLSLALGGCDAADDAIDEVVGCAAMLCVHPATACMLFDGKPQCMPKCEADDDCGSGLVCCNTKRSGYVCGQASACE